MQISVQIWHNSSIRVYSYKGFGSNNRGTAREKYCPFTRFGILIDLIRIIWGKKKGKAEVFRAYNLRQNNLTRLSSWLTEELVSPFLNTYLNKT